MTQGGVRLSVKYPGSKCSKTELPLLTDLELDLFLNILARPDQAIVVSVFDSRRGVELRENRSLLACLISIIRRYCGRLRCYHHTNRFSENPTLSFCKRLYTEQHKRIPSAGPFRRKTACQDPRDTHHYAPFCAREILYALGTRSPCGSLTTAFSRYRFLSYDLACVSTANSTRPLLQQRYGPAVRTGSCLIFIGGKLCHLGDSITGYPDKLLSRKLLERKIAECFKQVLGAACARPISQSEGSVDATVKIVHPFSNVPGIICNALLIKLLKIRRQPTTGFALFGAHEAHSPSFRRSHVLLETKLHEIIEIHSFAVDKLSATLYMHRDIPTIVPAETEAAWYSTFSYLEASQKRDSAEIQYYVDTLKLYAATITVRQVNGFYTSLPNRLTVSGLFPPFAWFADQNPSKKSVDGHMQHVAKSEQPVQCDRSIYREGDRNPRYRAIIPLAAVWYADVDTALCRTLLVPNCHATRRKGYCQLAPALHRSREAEVGFEPWTFRSLFTGNSTETLGYDLLQLDWLHRCRLMFQLVRYSRYLRIFSQGKLFIRLLKTLRQHTTGYLGLISCSTLPVPNSHATRRRHEVWDTARLPKRRQGKSRGRGWVRTTDLLISEFTL
ncbi:LOW QUALITY PROTEIN: hypothetical protein T265_12590 [Opisthorchis viverrini]|uniref:Uncharacterized protein n=1 Tax=Opisthorchis viverrini TaxID=6198 RepID=A0A075A2C3_OPIVI|nr:LOW QUALITY PROTEIN: hypothetical protein T265_12590 [Opisthorchis viverrini]KER33521.1 LOW QUALITY PROTEIN: hypothetical protein T265_12590 [Opisthorchis viverrini]